MIRKERVFDEGHVPDQLHHRDAEQQFLAEKFKPARHGRGPDNVLVHGPHGVGKTLVTGQTLQRLHRRFGVDYAHVDSMGKTTAGIVRATLQELGADPDQNTPTEDLCLQLRERVDEPTIVVLDESDDLPTTDALPRLYDVPNLALVPIVHKPDEWLARVDDRVREALHGEALALERYTVSELADILEPRAREGLWSSVPRAYLEDVADHAAGQARKAIQTLRAAGELAGERDLRVHEVPAEEAYELALRRIRQANLNSMSFHHHVLYELIREAGSLESGELHERYETISSVASRSSTMSAIPPTRFAMMSPRRSRNSWRCVECSLVPSNRSDRRVPGGVSGPIRRCRTPCSGVCPASPRQRQRDCPSAKPTRCGWL